jgi:outer membrane protein insertion porin family
LRLREVLLGTLGLLALTAMVAGRASASPAMPASQETTPPQAGTSSAQPTPASTGMSSYEGLTILAVHFPQASEQEQKRLNELVSARAGEPLDREQVRQSVQALYKTGRFADISVEAERTASGQVELSFVTVPNYFIGDVIVEGTPNRPNQNQVVNASKLQLGEPFSSANLDRALSNIRQIMQENGYYHATVSAQEQRHPDTQQIDVHFQIVPGAQAQIGRVTVRGNAGYSDGQIQDIAGMEPGDAVTVQRVSNALDRLRKKYQKQNRLLSQVSIASRVYRPEVNAVDFTFDIQPGPKVEIAAEGSKISPRVLKRNIPVYEENALDDDLLNEGRRNLLNYMQSRGYFDATVGLKKHGEPSDPEVKVIYIVDEGPRHKLVRIEIAGNKYFPEELLRSLLQVQPAGRFVSHGRYSQGLLNGDLHGLENLYRNNGFQQVKITSETLDNYRGQQNQLVVKLTVNEGPQTVVGALHIVGNASIPEDEFPALNTAVGQPFSESNVSSDRDIVLNHYFNRGFPNASFEASAKPSPDDPNRMDVTFTLHEGDQVFVDQVLVSGLDHTRPFIVQRELQVKTGDPLSQLGMLRTQQGLYNLGIFSQVDTAVQNPEGTEREKNVLVDVQEAKRYTFQYGLGLEFQTGQPAIGTNQPQGQTGVSPRVSFEVTRLNFRGLNHTITFKAHVGRLQQRGLISYDAPSLLNSRNWRGSITAFYDNTLDVTTFTSERLEGSVQAAETLTRAGNGTPVSTMLYHLTYRRVRASNIEISSNQIPLLSQPTRVGIPGFTYIRDKRDNPLESTRGNYTTVDGGVANSYFGSEADFSRALVQNSTYHAFGKNRPAGKKFVFARSTRIGVETAFGNTLILPIGQSCPQPNQTACPTPTVIPLPERFFSGGGNSHRGFGLNQAGPRDPTSGFPLGGSALFLNNLELRFPPATLPFFQDNLSFAVFHDAGNVFNTGHDMLHNLLRWQQKNPQFCEQAKTAPECDYSYVSHAIGVGVRYKTPIGPVRFDFGYNLNPPRFPSTQTTTDPVTLKQTSVFVPQQASHFNVYFSIGQTF